MRTPRYLPPQKRHQPRGPVLALPSDAYAVFEREWLLARSRASGIKALPSPYRMPVEVNAVVYAPPLWP